MSVEKDILVSVEKDPSLPALHRDCLGEVVKYLPFCLRSIPGIDNDVVGFTRNSGWQKIDDLMPSLVCSDDCIQFGDWIDALRDLTEHLEVSRSFFH